MRPEKRQQELTAAIFHQKYSVSGNRGVVGQKKSGQDKQALEVTVLLSSGKIPTLSMSSGALKIQHKQKSGRAIALQL